MIALCHIYLKCRKNTHKIKQNINIFNHSVNDVIPLTLQERIEYSRNEEMKQNFRKQKCAPRPLPVCEHRVIDLSRLKV